MRRKHRTDDRRASALAVERLARRQHGVVTRRQLIELGVSPRTIDRRVEARRLRRLHRGVYLVGPIEPLLARQMAAVLACGDASVLSHGDAAAIHKLLPCRSKNGAVHVTVPDRDPGRKPGIRIHRARVDPDERTSRHGIPVTTAARTIVDLAPELDAWQLEQLVAEAFRRHLTSVTRLREMLDRYPKRAGTAALRRLLNGDRSPAFLRSEAERRLLALIRRARLPEPETNATLGDFEIDFLWREERLVVEVDGGAFHSALPDRRRDQRKDAALVAAGYTVVRIGWHQITGEPEATVTLIARVLERRGAA